MYEPFGKFTTLNADWSDKPGGSTFAWSYLHQGLRFNTVLSFYDNRSRWYDPVERRFTIRYVRFVLGD
jgi:hypothetical protein